MDEQKAVFEAPLRIHYVPPRWLLTYLLITCFGAIGCLISTDLIWPVKALLLLLMLALMKPGELRQIIQQQVGLVLDAKDHWYIIKDGNNGEPARLVQASIALPEFIVLALQTMDGNKHRFYLTAASLDRTTLRRLRIRLYYPKVRAG